MKTRFKHLSKSTISILLALMMVISTVAVGIVTTTAAFVDQDASVGWDTGNDGFCYSFDGTNWTTANVDSNGVATLTVNSNVTCQYVFKIKWTPTVTRWYKKSSSNGTPNPVAQTSMSVSDSWARWDFSTWTDKPDEIGTDNFSVNLVKGTYKIKMLNTEGTYGEGSNVNLKYQFYKVVDDGVYAYGDFNGKKDWSSADISRPMTEYPASSGKYYIEITSGSTDDASLAKFRFTKWASDSITKYQADANEKSLDDCTTYEAADVGRDGDGNCWNYTFSVGDKVWFEPSSKKAWVETTTVNYTVNFGVQTDSENDGIVAAKIDQTEITSPYSASGTNSITFTATPAFGYSFDGWYNAASGGTISSSNNPYTASISSETNLYAKFTANTVDKYYLGGRMAIATAADNINANTTGANDGVHGDGWGIEKTVNSPSGSDPMNYWTYNEPSTNLKFAKQSDNLYKLETHRTISQLSETHSRVGGTTQHDPFYFIVHDRINRYVTTDNKGANFESNTENNKLALETYTGAALGNTATSNQMVFTQLDNQSNGQVTFWLDDSDGIKIWYTLDAETPGVGERVTLSASPSKFKTSTDLTLTANVVNPKETNAANLRYTFYKSSDGSSWTRIGNDENLTTATITTQETTAGKYYYRVVVSSTDTAYSSRKAETTATAYKPGLYISDHISDTSSVSWSTDQISYATKDTPYKETTGNSYTNSNPYIFTLSSTGTWDPDFDFDDYTIMDDLNQFCTIERSYVDVALDDGDTSIRTYKVIPNPQCKNPTIYIDFKNKKIWAIATYTQSSDYKKNTSDFGSETVTYYFAEADYDSCLNKSNPSTGGTAGMRINYWNNSAPSAMFGNTDVVTPVNIKGKDDSGNVTTNNKIYVQLDKLFTNAGTTWHRFNVYSVELPIWATSFQFTTSTGKKFGAQPTYTMKNTNIEEHSITLNPNRIYLLYDWGDSFYVKGVVLDETMWDGTRTKDNEVKQYNVDTNIINYTDNERLQSPYKPNGALSAAYSSNKTPNALYFGFFFTTKNAIDTGMTGSGEDYYDWDSMLYGFDGKNKAAWAKNLAQRKDDQAYYASVQNMVGMTTSKTKFNRNGDGNSFGYLMDTKGNDSDLGVSSADVHPVFDYEHLPGYSVSGTDSHNATQLVEQGKKFPFYESYINGITTFSYDSTTDHNRLYQNGNFTVEDGYKTGRDGDTEQTSYVGLFPFGGNTNEFDNCGFGLEFDLNFYMSSTGYLTDKNGKNQDIAFNFSGDDDVWVYVDGVKVLDLGGSHKISAATINFTDKKVYYKSSANSIDDTTSVKDSWASNNVNYINAIDLGELMAAYGKPFDSTDATTKHTFQMFYLERGAMQSNCVISFNLPQASGLNIKNNITADHVNPALKQIALHAANPDYFTYQVSGKLVNGSLPSGMGAKAPAATQGTLDFSKPTYPYSYETKRVYSDSVNPVISYTLSTNGGSESAGDSLSYNSAQWTPVINTVYGLSDPYLQATTEGKAAVTGKTDASGYFHLLGGQLATFEDKVPANAYVKVVQTQGLGEVNTHKTPIQYKEVQNNDTGNYYLTSYSVYDERAKKYIVSRTDLPVDLTNDHYAADARLSSTDGKDAFYFSNYTGDESDSNTAMRVDFYNDIAVGTIRIQKQLDDHSASDAVFRYTVKFSRVFGDEEDSILKEYNGLEYNVFNEDGTKVYSAAQIYGRGGIALKAGQYAEIYGVPVESRFEVEERNTAGYSFKQLDKTAYKNNGTEVYTTDETSGDAQKYYKETITDSPKTSDTVLWTEKAGTEDEFHYYLNMIPTISETMYDNNREHYISRSDILFTNQKNHFTVTFKYYDRDLTNNQPASISDLETVYSKKWNSIDNYIEYDTVGTTTTFKKIRFEDLIKDSVEEFNEDTNVSNLIDDYHMWTTQAKAVAGFSNLINLHTGKKYSETKDDTQLVYHTTRNGELNSSGEKWVNYISNQNKYVDAESFNVGDLVNYDSVRTIVVWLYNVPKAYEVNIYGAAKDSDLGNPKNITIATGNGALTNGIQLNNARVAKVASTSQISDTFYYSQRLGYNMGDDDYLDKIAYLSAYGVSATKNVLPSDYAPKQVGDYQFAYWAFDKEGTQVASTEQRYGNRVTGNFDLYAVYIPVASAAIERGNADNNLYGLTILEDATDTFVDSNGTPKVRINVMFNPYNLDDYDENIQNAALINVYTTKLISKLKAEGKNDEQIKQTIVKLQSEYKTQLLGMLENLTLNKKLAVNSLDGIAFNPAIELTSRGYVYTTNGSGSVINLTNKNRLQMTTQFSKSSLYADDVTTGILQIGAMRYNGNWILSDNCVYRTFSKS